MSSRGGGLFVQSAAGGEPVELSSLWRDRKIALFFLRQLSCRFCLAQVKALTENKVHQRLAAAGIPLVVFSLGSQAQAKRWLEVTGYTGELYLDQTTSGDPRGGMDRPGSLSYAAFRLVRRPAVGPGSDERTVSADGFSGPDLLEITSTTEDEVVIYAGDVFQLGGAFVVGPGNFCDYAFRSEYAGHHPELAELVSAATGLQMDGSEFIYPSTEQWYQKLNAGAPAPNPPQQQPAAPTKGLPWLPVLAAVLAGCLACLALLPFRLALPCCVLCAGSAALLMASWHQAPSPVNQSALGLLTPRDIDEKALDAGLLDCDCGVVMGAIPMLDLRDPGDPLPEPENIPPVRSPAATWSPDYNDFSNEYQTMLCYLREFLAKPHPAVGRPGPVCPFVPTALKRDIIYLSMVHASRFAGPGTPAAERVSSCEPG